MNRRKRASGQIAALPLRWDAQGRLRVLMVTSRETKRWVMPKGWLMNQKKPWNTAKVEALEEAGAVGIVSDEAIGAYHYIKQLDEGGETRCRVVVYPMMVAKLKRRWKERAQRKRHRFSPNKAAKLVDEKELSKLLKDLARRPDKLPAIAEMRKRS